MKHSENEGNEKMNTSDTLIQKFMETRQMQAETSAADRKAFEERCLEQFNRDCLIWMAPLMYEIQDGKVEFQWDKQGNYTMVYGFTWNEARGVVSSGWFKAPDSTLRSSFCHTPQPQLEFEVKPYNGVISRWNDDLDLPFEIDADCDALNKPGKPKDGYNHLAQPIPELSLGELLARTQAAVANAQAYAHQHAEECRSRRIETLSSWMTRPEDRSRLEENMKQALEVFPEESKRWDGLRQKGDEYLAQLEQAAAQKAEDDWQRQREYEWLEQLALEKFTAFICYRVSYTIAQLDQDADMEIAELITKECFTARPEPDSGGWWSKLKYGKVYLVRLSSVLSVEQVICARPNDAPGGVCAHGFMQSEKFENMRCDYFFMPAESGVEFLENKKGHQS